MNNSPLVSAVVPAFNNGTHIAATLKSIIAQDYENLEIICVNDASTDETLKNAEEVLKNSGRKFKIINHEKNSGVSASRNTGIKNASGEYIFFCDGDDLINKNFVTALLELIKKYDCDISFGGMVDYFEDGRPEKFWPVNINSKNPMTGSEVLELRINSTVVPTVCAMMFRKKFLDEFNLYFSVGCTASEDIEFQMKTLCRAKKISFTSECLYIYVHGPEMGSVRDNDTAEKKLRRYIDSTDAHYRTAEYLSVHAPSEKIKFLAENMIMPEAVIRRFTIAAMKNDKGAYKSLCRDKILRGILFRTRKIFFKKPEVFFKALMILFAPGLYFLMRRKK
ncbi:MAG: glycosyltransferase family 2 protein [Synergistales bacterium]|nr:glycosyltransferase family 2 protein [Synergistales bacterium]MDY6401294.1 glycosyltransferase family 2 protein [Synergistales bacterium]MDY6404366.1 glycosyltransferase family 2 protein [Synergistales bacterium]MDY6410643.1 glycosyltransferase family 2 protein [Synergistales bacterium]MDY6414357.1 glycosyltransferase family 2 protein [Synergistales bacterium]